MGLRATEALDPADAGAARETVARLVDEGALEVQSSLDQVGRHLWSLDEVPRGRAGAGE